MPSQNGYVFVSKIIVLSDLRTERTKFSPYGNTRYTCKCSSKHTGSIPGIHVHVVQSIPGIYLVYMHTGVNLIRDIITFLLLLAASQAQLMCSEIEELIKLHVQDLQHSLYAVYVIFGQTKFFFGSVSV